VQLGCLSPSARPTKAPTAWPTHGNGRLRIAVEHRHRHARRPARHQCAGLPPLRDKDKAVAAGAHAAAVEGEEAALAGGAQCCRRAADCNRPACANATCVLRRLPNGDTDSACDCRATAGQRARGGYWSGPRCGEFVPPVPSASPTPSPTALPTASPTAVSPLAGRVLDFLHQVRGSLLATHTNDFLHHNTRGGPRGGREGTGRGLWLTALCW
jgi:hypothetical protein